MPRAQQEALASQYGVDLDSIAGSAGQQNQRPQNVTVVEPVDTVSSDERAKNQEQDLKNNGLKPFGYDLFAGSPTTFAPVTDIPIPNDYTWAQATYCGCSSGAKRIGNWNCPSPGMAPSAFPSPAHKPSPA